MSHLFVEQFLRADGMHKPEAQSLVGLSETERTEYVDEVARVRQTITECLSNEYREGCLVKMNWSSTVDAEFISQTLECTSADEVFLQLKASSNIGRDLCEPFDTTYCLQR